MDVKEVFVIGLKGILFIPMFVLPIVYIGMVGLQVWKFTPFVAPIAFNYAYAFKLFAIVYVLTSFIEFTKQDSHHKQLNKLYDEYMVEQIKDNKEFTIKDFLQKCKGVLK